MSKDWLEEEWLEAERDGRHPKGMFLQVMELLPALPLLLLLLFELLRLWWIL